MMTQDPPAVGAAIHQGSGLPLHVQLRRAVLTEIHERGLRPGDRLPTEGELEQRYGVSRSTIRQAMADLATEGHVTRVQGKGTFVGTPKIQHLPVLESFSELLRKQGYDASHRLLESEVREAPGEVAEGLGTAVGTPCRRLQRLFLADGSPVGTAETWLPIARLEPHDQLLADPADGDWSLYAVLQDEPFGLRLARAIETVNPAIADDESARLLRCAPGTLLLLIHRVTHTADDEPLEWSRLRFLGGHYEYRVELHPSRPAEGPA
ncbi:GntR family transcriptional regulator [Egibacter rhizosphaerae]|uniref:GntR family transcriptional regulator n=1 Tax=Egibacter rhizosphaerae TaxID=1670831 RepID=A0A411YBN0_9ACTN|nr:GntR family transcriptional regulator [Egibacter rhizosphaerae]QBI18609.1 GntR family transcriptional regulator [Egibacter rhizosphaerae]